MSDKRILRFGGVAMALSGAANVVFWLMAWKVGSFVGGDSALDPLWEPAQWVHVVAAAFGALGLIGLYGALRARLASLGFVCFVVALIGTMCYFADGVIALTVYPILARQAPELLAAAGAMNVPPMLFAYVAFSAISMIGLVALGGVFLKERAFPPGSIALFIVGAVLSNLPPDPVPVHLIQFGCVLFGLGAIWMGLRAAKHSRPQGERRLKALNIFMHRRVSIANSTSLSAAVRISRTQWRETLQARKRPKRSGPTDARGQKTA